MKRSASEIRNSSNEGNTTDQAATRLTELAQELRLTPKQRRFAEALAADPQGRASVAAKAAGCGKGAEVTASKWLRMAKVQTYLQALTSEAAAASNARTAGAVIRVEDVLALLSAQAEGRAPSRVLVAEGQRRRVAIFEPGRAATMLLRYHRATLRRARP